MEIKRKWKYLITPEGEVINSETGYKLKFSLTSGGYNSVVLAKKTANGPKPVTFQVHRLVAELYCKKPKNCNIVFHLDGDKTNNHYTNLKWISSVKEDLKPLNRSSKKRRWKYKGVFYESTTKLAKHLEVYHLPPWAIKILLDTGTLEEVFEGEKNEK